MIDSGGAARLETLLSTVPVDEITAYLGRRRFEALHSLVAAGTGIEFSDSLIPRYAVALEGPHILGHPPLLANLLLGLGPSRLRALTKRHLDLPFAKDADNALALASKPLRANSSLTREILQALGLTNDLLPDVERRPAVEVIEPYEPLPSLHDYQLEVKAICLKLLAGGAGELLIQMPTGSGKTRTAMELLVDLADKTSLFKQGKSVVWLAHTEELCEQAIDSFSSVWATRGTERIQVARLWGSYTPTQGSLEGAFVVAGTSRMHALRNAEGSAFQILAKASAIIVLDEAHRALAPTVQAQIASLRRGSNGVLLGLSATPARTSDASAENAALADLFGRNLVNPNLGDNPIDELRKRGVLAKLERVELNYTAISDLTNEVPPGGADDEDVPESVLVNLASHPGRNAALIQAVESRASLTTPAIVFCCSVAHAELLASALRLRGRRAAAVDCHMRRGFRRSVIQQFSRGELEVLLNFGVLSTGFDAPNVRTVVIARPTKSIILYSQMLGRGLRGPAVGGTEICTLVDVRDHLGRFGELEDLYLRFKPYWT